MEMIQKLILLESKVIGRSRKYVSTGEAQAKGSDAGEGAAKECSQVPDSFYTNGPQTTTVYCQISLFLEACFGGRLQRRDSQSRILLGSSCAPMQMGEHLVLESSVVKLQRCELKRP